jgi:hypothetical protein
MDASTLVLGDRNEGLTGQADKLATPVATYNNLHLGDRKVHVSFQPFAVSYHINESRRLHSTSLSPSYPFPTNNLVDRYTEDGRPQVSS